MKFIDTLYGEIFIPIKMDILTLPELQRLREIRLCNINSPFITGASSINRFEHAIGTCYLAYIYCKRNKIVTDRDEFLIASLLHDIITPPFGHSFEYIFEALNKKQYEHANLETFFTGKTIQDNLPYYMGVKSKIKRKTVQFDAYKVCDILTKKHELSKIIDSDIDIDNIDNVFRLARHVGIYFDKNTPLNLVNKIEFCNSSIKCNDADIHLVEEWYNVREQLYVYLLEDIYDFAAKAILERITIDMIDANLLEVEDWYLTDSQFIELAFKQQKRDIRENTVNLMTMNFPTTQLIFCTDDISTVDRLSHERIALINKCYNAHRVFLHFIRDVNKTRRPIRIETPRSGSSYVVGKENDRYLIGMFSYQTKSKAIESFENIKLDIVNNFGINLKEMSSSEPPAQQFSLF